MSHRDLEGKDIVITGGTGALGNAVVDVFAAAGARCHLPCVEASIPDDTSWKGSDRVDVHEGVDLGDARAVEAYYADLPPLWASVHLVGGFAMAAIDDTDEADVDRMYRLNAVTCFSSCKHAVRAIRRGAGGGRIVNVAARPVVDPAPQLAAYSMSKAAVAALTRTLAAELTGEGILVNAVLPSLIDTPPNRAAMPDADFTAWPKPAEIAETISFLASPANALTSGALVPVYGRS